MRKITSHLVLMCIIPFPPVQAIGAALVFDGIKDVIEDIREISDENERLQKLDEARRQEAKLEENQ